MHKSIFSDVEGDFKILSNMTDVMYVVSFSVSLFSLHMLRFKDVAIQFITAVSYLFIISQGRKLSNNGINNEERKNGQSTENKPQAHRSTLEAEL